jgi:PDZ domain-containing protein
MTEDHDDSPPVPDGADLAAALMGPTSISAASPVTVPALPIHNGLADIPTAPTEAPPSRPVMRRRRWWGWVVFVVLALAVVVAARWNLNYYALEPGTAQPVQPFITVPPAKNHPVSHPVLLTDVRIGRVTALTYLFYKLQGNTALYPLDEVTGGTPPSQLTAQGYLEMSQAEDAAKAAALSRLGYHVTATPSGAVIFGTYPGTPAYGVLQVGDVVTAVDGTTTPTAAALTTTLARYHSGQSIVMTVLRGGKGTPVQVPVTLRATEVDVGSGRMASLKLGIQPEDQVDFTFPFPVKIDVTDIGGPSAGLAMTLGVMDALTSGSITGGHTVAATGTIDSQGDVGDVGGVAQKTVAVEDAGATIFLVPPREYKAALSKIRPGLQVYAVSTLNQALQVLAAHGGKVPPALTSASPTASGSTAAG